MPSQEDDPLVRVQTPLSRDFAQQQQQKQQGNNYHSSSLRTMMNPTNVNKTNLHPTGVEYVEFPHSIVSVECYRG